MECELRFEGKVEHWKILSRELTFRLSSGFKVAKIIIIILFFNNFFIFIPAYKNCLIESYCVFYISQNVALFYSFLLSLDDYIAWC